MRKYSLLLCIVAILISKNTLADSSTKNATSFTTVSISKQIDWTNPLRANRSDDSYSNSNLTLLKGTYYFRARNFSFNVPTTATINGIQVDVELRDQHSPVYLELPYLNHIQLVNTTTLIGGDYGSADYGVSDVGDTYISVGNSTHNWSYALTPALINEGLFGVSFRVLSQDDSYWHNILLDHVQMTVHWTNASTGNPCLGTASGTCTCGYNYTTNIQINNTINFTGSGVSFVNANVTFDRGISKPKECLLAIKNGLGSVRI